MTATTRTTGTTGPRPLWKAYDEALEKNWWRLGGVMERAVLGMAFAKMLSAWETYASFPPGCGFLFERYFDILCYGDGRKMWMDLGRVGVVRMTDTIGPGKPEERRLLWLCDFFTRKANLMFGTCLKDGFSLVMMRFCVKQLALEAGCDDEDCMRFMEFDPRPVVFPFVRLSTEDAEKMIADLKKMGGEG